MGLLIVVTDVVTVVAATLPGREFGQIGADVHLDTPWGILQT